MFRRPQTLTAFAHQFSRRPLHSRHPNLASNTHTNTNTNTSKTAQSNPKSEPAYPSFNFADLGATRVVKVTVLAALGVFATLETVFWTKALWRYFVPPESAASSPTSSDQSSSPEQQADAQQSVR